MIRIFSFVASCAGKQSKTLRYSDRLAEVFSGIASEEGEEVIYEKMTGDELDIRFCRSCNSCFVKGECPLDSLDDMPILKEKILKSDIFFFGTPVYLNQMSGLAKSVLDRISYWAHRFELTGKPTVAFATTSNSAGAETANALGDLLLYTGAPVVARGYARLSGSGINLYRDAELLPELEKISRDLMSAWKDPSAFLTPLQESAFLFRMKTNKRNRALADLIESDPWDEVVVCERRGMDRFESFAKMTEYVKRNGGFEDDPVHRRKG